MNKAIKNSSRRNFLQGLSISTASLLSWPLLNTLNANHSDHLLRSNQRATQETTQRVAIVQDKAIFIQTDSLEAYLPAKSYASATNRYLNSIDEQTFLSRHWFI